MLKSLVKNTPLRALHDAYLMRIKRHSQSDENLRLGELIRRYKVPKTFVEFGFHPREFNCVDLTGEFTGLLIDGDEHTVKLARRMIPKSITIEQRWLTLDGLGFIEDFCKGSELGVLSVDVDGNDYWFLQKLISLRPAIIVCEYNASFLDNPVTVPYDAAFERHAKHESGWYHGASLSALDHLCTREGYRLMAVASGGGNGFFVRSDLLAAGDVPLNVKSAYAQNELRNKWSGTTAEQQWDRIRHMPFVDVARAVAQGGTPGAQPAANATPA